MSLTTCSQQGVPAPAQPAAPVLRPPSRGALPAGPGPLPPGPELQVPPEPARLGPPELPVPPEPPRPGLLELPVPPEPTRPGLLEPRPARALLGLPRLATRGASARERWRLRSSERPGASVGPVAVALMLAWSHDAGPPMASLPRNWASRGEASTLASHLARTSLTCADSEWPEPSALWVASGTPYWPPGPRSGLLTARPGRPSSSGTIPGSIPRLSWHQRARRPTLPPVPASCERLPVWAAASGERVAPAQQNTHGGVPLPSTDPPTAAMNHQQRMRSCVEACT